MEKLPGALSKPEKALMKNREIYLIPKSTATLTQSGLLAMLLQRQRQKVQRIGPALLLDARSWRHNWSTVATWVWCDQNQ